MIVRRSAALAIFAAFALASVAPGARADSVNSPNLMLQTDVNRASGPAAGGASVTVSTITVAETMLAEYASGAAKKLMLRVRPGFELDPTSDVSATSATIGFNGAAINTAALLTPSGAPEETLTWTLTSGTNDTVQDLIRINGIKIRIHDASAAVGIGSATLSLTTAALGGAFTNQGVATATFVAGAPDHLRFTTEPVAGAPGAALLPAVALVDVADHVVTSAARTITLAIGDDPGGTALTGATTKMTTNGVATWLPGDALGIAVGGDGYTLVATHDGGAFLSSDTAESAPFDVAPSSAVPLALQSLSVKPGGQLKLAASGVIPLASRPTDVPTVHGGALTVTGPSWSLAFPLAAAGWQGLGPGGDGSKGYRFRGVVCTSVVVTASGLKASCRVEVGTFTLPEPGPIAVSLALGVGRAQYCGACGGTMTGAPAKAFSRKACPPPPACAQSASSP